MLHFKQELYEISQILLIFHQDFSWDQEERSYIFCGMEMEVQNENLENRGIKWGVPH